MTDRSIMFSAPMIQALQAGRKTQTRRVLKLPTKTKGHAIYERKDMGGWEPTTNGGGCFTIGRDGSRILRPETVGIWHRTCGVCLDASHQAGDMLWVRENWRAPVMYDDTKPRDLPKGCARLFEADDTSIVGFGKDVAPYSMSMTSAGRFRPSMYLPRWGSRFTLCVRSVKVERLQDISEDDAVAEGLWYCEEGKAAGFWFDNSDETKARAHGDGVIECYADLWNIINGPDAWAANPWITATTFEVLHGNIDSVEFAW